jgi:hypothetical protein
MVGEKGMVEKAKGIVFDNESGMYYAKYFGDWWLLNDLDQKEVVSIGVSATDYAFYSNENKTIMAKRKEDAKKGEQKSPPVAPSPSGQRPPARPVDAEIVEPEVEREENIEAKAMDISQNSDLVLQYEAPFTDRKTGEKTVRKWLGVNAWKLGLVEGYIKTGFSCSIAYESTDELLKCHIKLKKGDQEVISEGTYTKNRLRTFLSSSKEECFETFAFRNAIKKIVSLKDVVTAVNVVQAEIAKMGLLPTKDVKSLGE